MIYFNKPIGTHDISYVICDFDHTITDLDSSSSWGIYSSSPLLDEKFKRDLNTCYSKYRPIELDHQIPHEERLRLLSQWPLEEISFFALHHINIELFNKIARMTTSLRLRRDFPNFVHNMNIMHIPVYIVSGGLFEPIKEALKRSLALEDNVSIITNHVKVVDGEIRGLCEPVIHTYNKDTIKIPVKEGEMGLLFGDLPSDKAVSAHLKTINIGFLNGANLNLYNREFDIVLTDNSSFDNVGKILFKQYKK